MNAAASGNPADLAGAYASLSALVRLQHAARGFGFLRRQPSKSLLSGRYASRVRGRGLNFEEIRGYLPGDDVRNIDWKITARTQEPHIRVYTEERDRPALFVVDQRISMFFGSRRAMKSVAAAEAAALGAWRVLGVGDRVGGLVFDDKAVTEQRPHRSRASVMRLLETVTAYNQALRADTSDPPKPTMLNHVLERTGRLAKHDHLVVLISDFDGADSRTRQLVTRLKRHNDVVVVLVHDPLAQELPEAARMVVGDGTLQVELDLGSSRVRRDVLKASAERIRSIFAWQPKLGIPVLPISTGEEVAAQIRHLLGNRPGTRRHG